MGVLGQILEVYGIGRNSVEDGEAGVCRASEAVG